MNRIFFLLFLIPIFHSRSIKPKVSLCENVVSVCENAEYPLYPGPFILTHQAWAMTIHIKVHCSHTKTSPSSVIIIRYHSFEIILLILYQAYSENVILAFTRNAEYSVISWDSV